MNNEYFMEILRHARKTGIQYLRMHHSEDVEVFTDLNTSNIYLYVPQPNQRIINVYRVSGKIKELYQVIDTFSIIRIEEV